MVCLYVQHKNMWKRFIYLARLHFWKLPAFQKWIMDAVVSYGKLLLQVRADVTAKKRKKLRPEVYETRLLGDFSAVLFRNTIPKLLSADRHNVVGAETDGGGDSEYFSIDSSSVGTDSVGSITETRTAAAVAAAPAAKSKTPTGSKKLPPKVERSPSIDSDMVADIVAADFGMRPRLDGRPRQPQKKEQGMSLPPPAAAANLPPSGRADSRAESSEDRYEECFQLIGWHISQLLFEYLESPLLLTKVSCNH